MANVIFSLCSIVNKKWLLSQRHPLNIDSLKQVKNKWEKLGLDEGMGKCFQAVMENFPKEPPWVMKNAQMALTGDDGKVLSFASGKEEWKISVSAADCQYYVEAPTKSAYFSRLCFRQQPLSIRHLKKVEKDLETWGPLTPAEKSCFTMVIQKFSQKPCHIQSNAQIKFIFDMDGENVEFLFISGNGKYKMNVTYSNGQPQHLEFYINSSNNLEGFSCSMQTLDVDNMREFQNQLAQEDLLTENLNFCFNELVDKLPNYSKLFGENLQINFTFNEQGLSLIPQSEEWEITVQSHDGKADFNIRFHTWELFWKQNKDKMCNLPIEKLEETRTEIRKLQGVPKSTLDKLNNAVSKFSGEIKCLQKNARLVIECDQGEMVFLSGQGENTIDIFSASQTPISDRVTCTWRVRLLRFLYNNFQNVLSFIIPIIARLSPLFL